MRGAYRYLVALLAVDVALQLTLAALGVFRADSSSKPAHELSVFDPHRLNGDIVILLALLLVVVAIAAREGRWRVALVVFVLALVQNPLAHAGTVGGAIHGLNAFVIAGFVTILAHQAWAAPRPGASS